MGTSLVVPIEIVPINAFSLAGPTVNIFKNSLTGFDTNDYDGSPVYYVEWCYINTDTAIQYCYLKDELGNVIATLTAAASTAVWTHVAPATITMTSGAHLYHVEVSGTTAAATFIVTSCKILVKQTNATKTRLQFVLDDGNLNTQASSYQVTSCISAGWQDNAHVVKWNKDSTKYASLNSGNAWSFETNMLVGGGTYMKTAAWDYTANAEVLASETTVNYTDGVSWIHSVVDMTDVNFGVTDGHDLGFKISSDANTGVNFIGAARLYLRLSNLTKAELYFRNSHTTSNSSGTSYVVQNRMSFDVSWFSSPTFYFEGVGNDTVNENNVALINAGTNDSGNQTTPVVTGTILNLFTTSGSIPVRVRSAAITLTGTNRYFPRKTSTVGFTLNSSAIIVDVQGTSAASWLTKNYRWDKNQLSMVHGG